MAEEMVTMKQSRLDEIRAQRDQAITRAEALDAQITELDGQIAEFKPIEGVVVDENVLAEKDAEIEKWKATVLALREQLDKIKAILEEG